MLNNLKRKDVLILGYGLEPKRIKVITEESFNNEIILKIVFGDSHMVFIYGKMR